jgi:[ribosomal protein S5]-alanine N-acetyltransferase
LPLAALQSIESVRTRLRLVERSDLPALLLVNGSDEVTRYLPYASWKSTEDAEAWYERVMGIQATGLALQFVLIEKVTNLLIGTCLLFRYDEGSNRAELGYVLGREHWGKGFMTEALNALVAHAFEVLGLRRLEAEVNPANTASLRTLERIGFTQEGVLRQRWVSRQEPYDVAVYGLLRHEYKQSTAAPSGV